jgi:hypothetical protein
MRGARLDAAKEAAKHFVDALDPDDEVCLVAYDDEVAVPLPLTRVSVPGYSTLEVSVSFFLLGQILGEIYDANLSTIREADVAIIATLVLSLLYL